MRTSDLTPGLVIGPLALAARDVPHATLETNRTCNMRCRLCYNLERDSVKSEAEVQADLDAALRLRNLAALTILGGEPTLHPGLPGIVAHVKSRGLFCALLTNGLRFLDADGPGLIGRLKEAGVDRIYIHVDSGQKHVHENVDEARGKMAGLLDAARVPFALSVTLYDGREDDLAAIIPGFSRFRYFEGVLATVPYDPECAPGSRPELRDVYEKLRSGLGLEPISFIPADRDDSDIRWLIYFYLFNVRTGRTFPVSANVAGLARRLFHWAPGRQYFAQGLAPDYLRTALAPIFLAELAYSPRRAAALVRFIYGTRDGRSKGRGRPTRLRDLRAQFITVQSPPRLDFAAGTASVCRSCPDATVRNGKLVPVCIADLVSPLGPGLLPKLACPAI